MTTVKAASKRWCLRPLVLVSLFGVILITNGVAPIDAWTQELGGVANDVRGNVVRVYSSQDIDRPISVGLIVGGRSMGEQLLIVTSSEIVSGGRGDGQTVQVRYQNDISTNARVIDSGHGIALLDAKGTNYESWNKNILGWNECVQINQQVRLFDVFGDSASELSSVASADINYPILIDSAKTTEEVLGSPVVTECGVIGLVIQDTGGSDIQLRALSIDSLKLAVTLWNQKWQLARRNPNCEPEQRKFVVRGNEPVRLQPHPGDGGNGPLIDGWSHVRSLKQCDGNWRYVEETVNESLDATKILDDIPSEGGQLEGLQKRGFIRDGRLVAPPLCKSESQDFVVMGNDGVRLQSHPDSGDSGPIIAGWSHVRSLKKCNGDWYFIEEAINEPQISGFVKQEMLLDSPECTPLDERLNADDGSSLFANPNSQTPIETLSSPAKVQATGECGDGWYFVDIADVGEGYMRDLNWPTPEKCVELTGDRRAWIVTAPTTTSLVTHPKSNKIVGKLEAGQKFIADSICEDPSGKRFLKLNFKDPKSTAYLPRSAAYHRSPACKSVTLDYFLNEEKVRLRSHPFDETPAAPHLLNKGDMVVFKGLCSGKFVKVHIKQNNKVRTGYLKSHQLSPVCKSQSFIGQLREPETLRSGPSSIFPPMSDHTNLKDGTRVQVLAKCNEKYWKIKYRNIVAYVQNVAPAGADLLWSSDNLPNPNCGPYDAAKPKVFLRSGDNKILVLTGTDASFSSFDQKLESVQSPSEELISVILDTGSQSPYLYIHLEPDEDETIPSRFRIYCKVDFSLALDVQIPGFFADPSGSHFVAEPAEPIADNLELQYVLPETATEFPGGGFAAQLGDQGILIWAIEDGTSRLYIADLMHPVLASTLGWGEEGVRLTYLTSEHQLGIWPLSGQPHVLAKLSVDGAAIEDGSGSQPFKVKLLDEFNRFFVLYTKRGLFKVIDISGQILKFDRFNNLDLQYSDVDWFHSSDGRTLATLMLYQGEREVSPSVFGRMIWLRGSETFEEKIDLSELFKGYKPSHIKVFGREGGRGSLLREDEFSILDLIFVYNYDSDAKVKSTTWKRRSSGAWTHKINKEFMLKERIVMDEIKILYQDYRRSGVLYIETDPEIDDEFISRSIRFGR